MMDYSKLSDFEINKLVAGSQSLIVNANQCASLKVKSSSILVNDIVSSFEFNPCKNPSDAWPIIVENNISLTKQSTSPGAHWHTDIIESIVEDASDEDLFTCKTLLHCHDKNPLRAAMIVYLMMQEDK